MTECFIDSKAAGTCQFYSKLHHPAKLGLHGLDGLQGVLGPGTDLRVKIILIWAVIKGNQLHALAGFHGYLVTGQQGLV